MYQMQKCIKCGCEQISKGSLSGNGVLNHTGIPDWLSCFITYTCNECGYTEVVKDRSKNQSRKISILGG